MFFLGIEVIEVAEEFVEAVDGRQGKVVIPQVVLAELTGLVADGFEHFGQRRGLFLQAQGATWHGHRRHAGANGVLAGQEGGAARRRTRLGVVIGELDPLLGDPVDVGGGVTHGAHAIGADVLPADVVTEDDHYVRFIRFCHDAGREDHAHRRRYFP